MRMGREVRNWCAVGFLMIQVLSWSVPAQAGWVDDWMDNVTASASTGGYFEGQTRGYWGGGGYGMRWANSSEALFNVEAPRIKAGCGGVNMYLGGVSFLNADYLVTKFQTILQNAAAVAFDLALNTLCQPCSNVLKAMESLENYLNGLQMNDCGLGTAVARGAMEGAFGEAMQRNKVQGSQNQFGYSWTESVVADKGQTTAVDVQKTQEGCDETWKQAIVGADLSGGYLLQKVGQRIGIPGAFVDLARATVGDVFINDANKAFEVSLVSPCEKNQGATAKALLDGTLQRRAAGGNCQDVDDAKGNLRAYMKDNVTAIFDKMKNRQALTADERDFIEKSPVPVANILRSVVMSGQTEIALTTVSDSLAVAYAAAMVEDLTARVSAIVSKAREAAKKGGKPATNANGATADVYECAPFMKQDVEAGLRDMEMRCGAVLDVLQTSLTEYQASLTATANLTQWYKSGVDQLQQKLGQQFGKSVANRFK